MSTKPHQTRLPVCLAILVVATFQLFTIEHAKCQAPTSETSTPSKISTPPIAAQPDGNAAAAESNPTATTVDANVTTAHLKLFVKPLTVDELKIEAKGWQNLLKQNVQKITSIHIRIEQITDQITALKDTPPVPSTTVAPASTPAEAPGSQPENDQSTTGSADSSPSSNADASAPPNIESLTTLRDTLSEQLTTLTIQKSQISEKFGIVLDSLELKGGDAEPYRKYNNALNGVALEVTSATGMWRMFTSWLIAEQGGKRWAWNLVRFIIIMLVSYFGASIIANFVRRGVSRVKGVSQLLVNFLSSFTKQLAIVIGFIIGLAALEIDITPLIAAVGAAGFVVAFALQGTLSNFASGLLILAYRPFDVGDVIEAGGVSGNVDSVSLFSTHVRTFDNKLMIVPNNDIWGGTITNATSSETRRVDLVFGIGYADDINQAKSILANAVENHPLILKDPAPNIRVNELGDSSVNLICRPWTRTENYWSVYWDLMHTVKQEFDKGGVSIPFPQRDVHVYQQNTDA
jgi:small conductance mechanosensitive channel